MSAERFKALIHYVCAARPNALSLGAVKLNKILWYSELECYLRGEPISEVPFIKLPFGPVPKYMDFYMEDLQKNKRIFVKETEYKGNPKQEFYSLEKPSVDYFTASQIGIIENVINGICIKHTAQSISEASHDEVWDLAELGEEMPFYAAYGKWGEISEEDIDWAKAQLSEIGKVQELNAFDKSSYSNS